MKIYIFFLLICLTALEVAAKESEIELGKGIQLKPSGSFFFVGKEKDGSLAVFKSPVLKADLGKGAFVANVVIRSEEIGFAVNLYLGPLIKTVKASIPIAEIHEDIKELARLSENWNVVNGEAFLVDSGKVKKVAVLDKDIKSAVVTSLQIENKIAFIFIKDGTDNREIAVFDLEKRKFVHNKKIGDIPFVPTSLVWMNPSSLAGFVHNRYISWVEVIDINSGTLLFSDGSKSDDRFFVLESNVYQVGRSSDFLKKLR